MNRLLIDLSSILRACHHAGKDFEFGQEIVFEEKKHWINSAAWAFENFVASYKTTLTLLGLVPYQTVLVLDGMDSAQFRRAIFPGYKAGRTKRPKEFFTEYQKATQMVIDEVTGLGGLAVVQPRMEADDVIAYLALNLQGRKTVWTRDGDLLALKDDDVDVLLNSDLNPATYKSAPDTKWICLYKSLVGDSSDGFPGAKGFGDKAFEKLCACFGAEGLEALEQLIIKRDLGQLVDDVAELPALKKIIDSQRDVYISYACAKFYTDRINTSADPIEITAAVTRPSEQCHMSLRHWGGTKKLSGVEDRDWILGEVVKGPYLSLDIETDNPAESKEWCRKIVEASKGRRKNFVDVIGSYLCGMSLTFGENLQHTVYMSCRHSAGNGWTSEQICDLIADVPEQLGINIHNTFFELPVLYNEWGGWLENVVDTALMSSWVNENLPKGLKPNSKHYLGYEQVTYEEVTTKDGIQYGMSELTAEEVFAYGADDTICTSAIRNRFQFTLELEKTWDLFNEVDTAASYPIAKSYVTGITTDIKVIEKLRADDLKHSAEQWEVVKAYLHSVGWEGCEYQKFERSPAGIKKAFKQMTGEVLNTRVRNEDKLIEAVRDQGAPELAEVLEGSDEDVDELLFQYFEPEPIFDVNKTAHITRLMYEAMKLPIRIRTVPTKLMRGRGQREGNPAGDTSAVDHALKLDLPESDERAKVLLAVREMKAVSTRTSLFYRAWPLFIHWKTGKIHTNPGMSQAATRRATPSAVNYAQLSKKGDGKKVRKMIQAPPGYIVCAMDLEGQELKLCAWASQDKNLLACYLGDHLLDVHSLTGSGVAKRVGSVLGDYEKFILEIEREGDEAKAFRRTGKAINFATQFKAMAKKLAKLLVVSESEAQMFLDAKNEQFPGIVDWQNSSAESAKQLGYALTFLGARRHLQEKLSSHDKWVVMEAERQACNFEIQGSAAEQLKLIVAEMARVGLFEDLGAMLVALIHDEAVAYIPLDNAVECIQKMHSCMTIPYADMAIPTKSDISIGWNFGETVGVGKVASREAIEKALEKLLTT